MKNCIFCKYWDISFEEDYSEYTPGSGFESECLKGHWRIGNEVSTKIYRKCISKAEYCEDYEDDS